MKKRILLFAVVLLLLSAFFMPLTVSAAEGGEVVEIVEKTTLRDYFDTNILPLLITAGSFIMGGLLVIAPIIRKFNKKNFNIKDLQTNFKALQVAYTSLKEERDNLKESINNLDADKLTAVLKENIGADMGRLFEEFKAKVEKEREFDNTALAQIYGTQELLEEKLSVFMDAAKLAWAGQEGVLNTLSEAPNAAVNNKLAYKNKLLQERIIELASGKGEAVIAEVENETEKAVRGE